jgi:hypothetical protein
MVAFPAGARARIQSDHDDGPVLCMRDGSMHWLTLWERFLVRVGLTDADTLECHYLNYQ